MVRIFIEGHGHEKVGKDLKNFFETGQRKIVRHYKGDEIPEMIGQCDVAIIELNEKQEVKKNDNSNRG